MNLVERVKGILLNPNAEWRVIEREPGDVQYLFKNYVAILALIPAVAGFVGSISLGLSIPTALFSAILGYVLAFVIAYVVALIIDALAPSFGGQKNFESALKVSVYSYTASWLASVFLIIPALGFLAILGLYGLYLLYLGLPVLMKSPKERSVLYAVSVIVCAILISIVIGLIQAALFLRAL